MNGGYRPVEFDEGIADRFSCAATTAVEELRDQGIWRRRAVDTATDGFEGQYARLFHEANLVESADRVRLARAVEELAEVVAIAKWKAREENERRRELASWQERENERQSQRFLVDATLPGAYVPGPVMHDPKPSEYQIVSPALYAVFGATDRARVAGAGAFRGGLGPGRTGAHPANLRVFAGEVHGHHAGLVDAYIGFETAWVRFAAACVWTPLEQISFLDGFDRYLQENLADATWVEHIADGFETAGRGTLTNFEVTFVLVQDQPDLLLQLLLTGNLGPLQVARTWSALVASPGVDSDALLSRHSSVFGSLDGMPALARVRANQYRVPVLLTFIEAELARVRDGDLEGGQDRAKYLNNEIAYLQRVQAGSVQLYL